jgi:hypothetical protein
MPVQNRISEEKSVIRETGSENRAFTFKATQLKPPLPTMIATCDHCWLLYALGS